MKFAVQKAFNNGGARAGVLHLPGSSVSIETPCLMLSTQKGLPHFLSPDLLSSLPSPDSHLLQISPLHFAEGLSVQSINSIGGLHKLVGLSEYGLGAVARDSIVCLPVPSSTNKNGASFETPFGRLSINPVEYIKMISSMKPNWCVSLPDEVPAWVTEKRNKSSVDRTIKWLDECIKSCETDVAMFGAIVGGSSLEERRRCAREVVSRNVSGYWIGGLGLGESIDVRPALLKCIIDILPEEKPRQVSGLDLPEEVMQGIAAGIDLFNSSYIYHITLGGYALSFPVDCIETHNSNDDDLSDIGGDLTKINLRATAYRKDATPIVENCMCYTCQNHTRAYIHHLLNVHEMLAQILLELHNTHHYLAFFRNIREAIKIGKFEQFQKNYTASRRKSRNHPHTVAEII